MGKTNPQMPKDNSNLGETPEDSAINRFDNKAGHDQKRPRGGASVLMYCERELTPKQKEFLQQVREQAEELGFDVEDL